MSERDDKDREIRRLRDWIVSARWRLAKGRGLWNGPCHECDMALERALKGDYPSQTELAKAARLPPGSDPSLSSPAHTTARPLDTSGKPPIAARGDSEQSNGVHEGATPSATTDAMERAQALADLLILNGYSVAPRPRFAELAAVAITSAVEQERRACVDRVLRLCDLYSGVLPSQDHVLDAIRAIVPNAILARYRSAEPPDTKGGE